MPKPDNTPIPNHYEDVLLCVQAGDQSVMAIPTIKWLETVLVPGKDTQGREIFTPAGFLVIIPPHNSLKIYSHICRNVQAHAKALAILEADKKNRLTGNLPLVWNGLYSSYPLCALLGRPEAK
jgi:hypothetical protein